MRAAPWALSLLIVVLLALWPAPAQSAPGFTDTCERALPKQRVDELIERMRAVTGDCTLARIDTRLFQSRVEWQRGEDRFTLLLGPRECVIEASHEGPELAYVAPPEAESACPEAVAALHAFVGDRDEALMPVLRDQVPIGGEADHSVVTPETIAAAAAMLALLLGGVLAIRDGRRLRGQPGPESGSLGAVLRRLAASHGPDLAAGLLLFVVALIARFAVPPSLGNWYGAFVPADPAEAFDARFGASSALLQTVVRALLPWTDTTAFALVRVVGALAVPLLVLVVRRLGGSRTASVVAGALLSVAPIAVRLSASSAEHVLAGTLALAAWAVWLRTASDERPELRALSLTLVLLATLARVDVFIQLGLIPLTTALVRPSERVEGAPAWLPLRRRLADAGLFALGWALIGAYAWRWVVIPSNHPGPDPEGVRQTAKLLVSQLWTVAATPPHWITPVALGLVALGLVAAVVQRRFGLLVALALGWALVFIPLGRDLTHDGLVGARYFVLALPLLFVLAGQLGDLAEAWPRPRPARLRRALPLIAAVVVLPPAYLAAQPGWRHEYSFQGEYRFLAEQLRGRELDGCTLWYVAPRQPIPEPDLDCCLDVGRSPLALVAPELDLQAVPPDRLPATEQGCHLYYRGSVCSLDPALNLQAPGTVAAILEQCQQLGGRAREPVRQEIDAVVLEPRFVEPLEVELGVLGPATPTAGE